MRSTLGVSTPTRKRQKQTPVEQRQQDVGIDLHRRRSVIVRRTEPGETFETVRIDNDLVALAAELSKAGQHPDVRIIRLKRVLRRRSGERDPPRHIVTPSAVVST